MYNMYIEIEKHLFGYLSFYYDNALKFQKINFDRMVAKLYPMSFEILI